MQQGYIRSWRDYVPKYISLYYVDYNENLNEHTSIQQQCLSNNNYEALHEEAWDWYGEQESENVQSYMDEIRTKMQTDGREEEYFEHEDEIRDMLHERNNSDPIDGLIDNTSEENMFYSLGVEIDGISDWGIRGESVKMSCYKIRRALGLKKGVYDKEIKELVENASYGGELRIYFNSRFDNWIFAQEPKAIRFHGKVQVAIADSGNGSGYDIELELDITKPFNRENLFIDREVKYSYAHDICGMCHDWCAGTQVEILHKPTKYTIKASKMAEHMKQEAEYNKAFKDGKCTFGDMNAKRHRDAFYINSFPHGSKCPHCGTFWID